VISGTALVAATTSIRDSIAGQLARAQVRNSSGSRTGPPSERTTPNSKFGCCFSVAACR
jgi:hypothetical protein